jgi:DNA-binding response OmpR family regulator
MSCRILVVEDEIFVAAEIESVIDDMGHIPAGIAADRRRAVDLGRNADIALVDLNLIDGATGLEVGRELAALGVTVLFLTANPSQLGDGVPGTIGVLPKPANEDEIEQAVNYVFAVRQQQLAAARPPARLRLFQPWAGLSAGLAASPIG